MRINLGEDLVLDPYQAPPLDLIQQIDLSLRDTLLGTCVIGSHGGGLLGCVPLWVVAPLAGIALMLLTRGKGK